MSAKENSDIQTATGTIYQLSPKEKIRQQCEAREDYYRRKLDRQRQMQWIDEQKKIAWDLKPLEKGNLKLEIEITQHELEISHKSII